MDAYEMVMIGVEAKEGSKSLEQPDPSLRPFYDKQSMVLITSFDLDEAALLPTSALGAPFGLD